MLFGYWILVIVCILEFGVCDLIKLGGSPIPEHNLQFSIFKISSNGGSAWADNFQSIYNFILIFKREEKIIIELISAIMINVTSGFLAVILISPGIFGVSSFNEYLRIFSTNLPFTILGFIISYWLLNKKEKYELKSE